MILSHALLIYEPLSLTGFYDLHTRKLMSEDFQSFCKLKMNEKNTCMGSREVVDHFHACSLFFLEVREVLSELGI